MDKFTLVSFAADGHTIKNAQVEPAFYGLVLNGQIVDYFTSVQAARYAAERLIANSQN